MQSNKTSKIIHEEPDDEDEDDDYNIFDNIQRYRTTLCEKEEEAMQDCVLEKRGLYGCEKEVDKYQKCKEVEQLQELTEKRKQALQYNPSQKKK
jgi:hypothetical protein